jgi:hypothetical protein
MMRAGSIYAVMSVSTMSVVGSAGDQQVGAQQGSP